ncbi:MAG: rod shape-determining protein RodA [Gammaproteobacteria bacterium]|nr:rod shape-determining protein RodA [Gammaproteobacteria bacterium]
MKFDNDGLNVKLSAARPNPWTKRLHLDLPLMGGLSALIVLAFVILYSASGQDLDVLLRQGGRLVLALAIMLLLAQIRPDHIKASSPLLFGAGVLLLGAVLVMGDIGKGAQRWLDLGVFRFQPSELMKLATPMMLAWYLSETGLPPRWSSVLIAGLLIVVPAALIAKQPDLGTAMLVAVSGSVALFLGGIGWAYLLALAIALGASLPIAWFMLHDYQRDRVLTFLNPEADPLGRGYHIIQSKIAIGSGGIYGKGWLHGTQGQLEFLPERSTDFIFAILAEEFGLVGCLGLLAVYLFILGRCLQIVAQAQDTFCRLLSGALTVTFFVYVFVNIGMVIGILPVVGVPLPLVSYGGTSMVTLLAAFGILMSIQTHRRLFPV